MTEHEPSIKFLNFSYRKEQRDRYTSGNLAKQWAIRYPEIFDERDVEISRNQRKRHFYEWLFAILIFESTGYFSLIEKYWSAKHPRKLLVYNSIAPRSVVELDEDYGWPDLFCYSPQESDWHFCEVKGGRDSLSKVQRRLYRKLYEITGKPVWVIALKGCD